MKQILLSTGFNTYVDDEDYEEFNRYNWHESGWGYVFRVVGGGALYMHHIILQLRENEQCDHIDGNKRNNQRANLRKVTRSQNQQNQGLQPNNTSGYIGVSFDNSRGKWCAYINKDRKRRFLGRHDTAEQAARAYDKSAKELYGDSAAVNFVLPTLPAILPNVS